MHICTHMGYKTIFNEVSYKMWQLLMMIPQTELVRICILCAHE